MTVFTLSTKRCRCVAVIGVTRCWKIWFIALGFIIVIMIKDINFLIFIEITVQNPLQLKESDGESNEWVYELMRWEGWIVTLTQFSIQQENKQFISILV